MKNPNKFKTIIKVDLYSLDTVGNIVTTTKTIKSLQNINMPKKAFGYKTYFVDMMVHPDTGREMFSDPYNESKAIVYGTVHTPAQARKILKEEGISNNVLNTIFDDMVVGIKKLFLPDTAKENYFIPYDSETMSASVRNNKMKGV